LGPTKTKKVKAINHFFTIQNLSCHRFSGRWKFTKKNIMSDNNIIKILKYLLENSGESKFILIDSILSNLSVEEKQELTDEMSRSLLIYKKGGDFGGESIGFMVDGYKIKTFGRTDNVYNPLQAKIRVEGIQFLNNFQNQMKSQSISVQSGNNSPVQIILDSKNVSIQNSQQANQIIDKIINQILDDTNLDKSIKREAIKEFEKAKEELENGNIKQSTIKKILHYGDQIGSIGSFVGLLAQLFQ
jgi:hypothetical protein